MGEILNPETGGSGMDELRYAVAPIRGVEFRDASANHDGSWTVSGYAAVFDQETVLYDGAYLQVRESIAPDAFDRVLAERPQVHLNVGHDMNRSIAATDVPQGEIGSLALSADPLGLRFFARVDRDDPDAQALAVKMKRGVAKQASFAFTIAQDADPEYDTTPDGREVVRHRIMQIRNLFDVCVTPQGAYGQTSAMLRSIGASLGQPIREAGIVSPETGGDNVVTSGDAGPEEVAAQRGRRISLLRLKVVADFPTQEDAPP